MNALRLFAPGISSVLVVTWTLRLETPLVIRSGHKSAFKTSSEKKSRYRDAGYKWNGPTSGSEWTELGELDVGVEIVNNGTSLQAEPRYRIPAKSLRGALRSWTLSRLAPQVVRDLLAKLPELDEKKTAAAIAGSGEPGVSGLADYLRGLFGLAGKEVGETDNLSSRGRLSLDTGPVRHGVEPKLYIPGEDWNDADKLIGPNNADRQLAVRGPVCRFTQAAKHGGLHQYLEFAAGQAFRANLRIINPQAEDLELLKWWRHELNSGLLRLGGLSSIGRGRLEVDSDGLYACESRRPPWWPAPKPVPLPQNDPFVDLWQGYALPKVEGYPRLTTLTQDAHADTPA